MGDRNLNPNFFGKVQSSSYSLLVRFNNENPLAGGAAKAKEVDKKVLDVWIDQIGMATIRQFGVNALEADWIATNNALFYVTPRAESVVTFSWSMIAEIKVKKQGPASTTFNIRLKSERKPFEMKTGRTSGERLLDLWRTFSGEA